MEKVQGFMGWQAVAMVTKFCNTVFSKFAKKHKVWHGNANYWPKDCFL